MSKSVVPSFSEGRSSVPGKVFLLGEYAVLAGAPALVATLGPRFSCERWRAKPALDARAAAVAAHSAPLSTATAFHPRSPAGRLLARARKLGTDADPILFEDPHRGEGGFGASTAQFALLYGALAKRAGWELSALGARAVYRELMGDEPVPPSGADLVAQWSGGVVRFDPALGSVDQCFESNVDWGGLLVFSAAGQAGRKVPTHDHLAALAGGGLAAETTQALGRVLDCALSLKDAATLGRCMSDYARVLAAAGLELEAARRDREALERLPGVLGVKGSGALLADAVVALVEGGVGASSRAEVIRAAEARGLRLVADGLGGMPQAGYVCAN